MFPIVMRTALAVAALLAVSGPAAAQQYRQVDSDGVGNCIFSNRVLGFGEEGSAAYRSAKTSFSEGEDVFVRCYFAQPLGNYARNGRRSNSLRNGEYFADLELRNPVRDSHGPDIVGGMRFSYDASESGMNQQRFDIGDVPDCDFRLPAYDARVWGVGENRCPDLARFTRALAESRNASYPFTATYCVKVFAQFSDVVDERREIDGNTGTVRVNRGERLMDHRISESCFDYTVSS